MLSLFSFAQAAGPSPIPLSTIARAGSSGSVGVAVTVAIIEVVMSLDNALMISASVSRLSGFGRRFWGLVLGLVGACALRFAALLGVSLIEAHPLVSTFGGAYLVYAMAEQFKSTKFRPHSQLSPSDSKKDSLRNWLIKLLELLYSPRVSSASAGASSTVANGIFWRVVALIIVNDLAFSIDNVVAVVSITHAVALLYIGVFVGMVVMFLVALLFVPFIERHPVLKDAAYILMGFAGAHVLVAQMGLQLSSLVTLPVIACIVGGALLYERFVPQDGTISRLLRMLCIAISAYAAFVDWLLKPVGFVCRQTLRLIKQLSGSARHARFAKPRRIHLGKNNKKGT